MKKNNSNLIRNVEKQKIITYFLTREYGTLVRYEELQKLTSYNLSDEYECYKFKCSFMAKVKEILIESGYVLKAVSKVGYYILKPNQIQSYTYRKYIRRPLKTLKKAEMILDNTEKDLLNKEEKEKHDLTSKLNKELIVATEGYINAKEFEELKK